MTYSNVDLMNIAIEKHLLCPEFPRVGAIIAKEGTILSSGYRGEVPGVHAERIVIEKLGKDELVDSTMYTTLEPCVPMLAPVIAEQVLEEIQTALLLDEQIAASYQGMSEMVLELRLHPLGLVTRGSVVYLVATANDYSDIRLYALHRFQNVIRTFEKIKPLKGFSLEQYIEEGALQFGNVRS